MGILKKLFGKKEPAPATPPEHAVIVHFQWGSSDLQPLYALEDELSTVLGAEGVGVCDGHDIAHDGSDGHLYLYGPDADRLYEVARPALEQCRFTRGAKTLLRYGPPQDGVKETVMMVAARARRLPRG